MTELYHICLFVGAALLAAGFFFGHGHDFDSGHELSVHDIDAHHGNFSHGNSSSEFLQFFNFRNLIFFTTFFGLTGTVFTVLGGKFFFTLLSSLGVGIFSAIFSHKLIKYLRRTESGEELHEKSLEGRMAKVVVGISREQRGKISLDVNGRILQLPARVAEPSTQENLLPGETVIILEMDDGTAHVIEENFSQPH